jgi:hypothetical protein
VNKLIGILFITAAACALATAQQQNKPSNAAAQSVIQAAAPPQTDQVVSPKPEFKFVIELPQTKPPTEGRLRSELPLQGFVVPSLEWVFKNGAVYMDFGNGMLVPVPGGGASGCFDVNLRERMDKLRTSIEAFPPRPQSPTTPRK